MINSLGKKGAHSDKELKQIMVDVSDNEGKERMFTFFGAAKRDGEVIRAVKLVWNS